MDRINTTVRELIVLQSDGSIRLVTEKSALRVGDIIFLDGEYKNVSIITKLVDKNGSAEIYTVVPSSQQLEDINKKLAQAGTSVSEEFNQDTTSGNTVAPEDNDVISSSIEEAVTIERTGYEGISLSLEDLIRTTVDKSGMEPLMSNELVSPVRRTSYLDYLKNNPEKDPAPPAVPDPDIDPAPPAVPKLAITNIVDEHGIRNPVTFSGTGVPGTTINVYVEEVIINRRGLITVDDNGHWEFSASLHDMIMTPLWELQVFHPITAVQVDLDSGQIGSPSDPVLMTLTGRTEHPDHQRIIEHDVPYDLYIFSGQYGSDYYKFAIDESDSNNNIVTVDGGVGEDTAIFVRTKDELLIVRNSENEVTVVDGGEVYRLLGYEKLEFSDGTSLNTEDILVSDDSIIPFSITKKSSSHDIGEENEILMNEVEDDSHRRLIGNNHQDGSNVIINSEPSLHAATNIGLEAFEELGRAINNGLL